MENVYYFGEATKPLPSGVLGKLTVVEVDTEEGWVLDEYAGAGYVESVPKYRQIDGYGRHEKVKE